ncbi:hypothetical protein ABOM_001849 [Aspergillus bombycis]|uniref:BD-FAE-like domain-containing protein n=1 Tax=Aspergillus bombycis TaxID=109264 RepID=A0A1F8ADB6_9EURO|nr:hypothetical protein ABOM_001849 [Aspergillus bombycis]OGM49736.1 hypothetical protein ABOM_001849 [Aspergillus bombycis]
MTRVGNRLDVMCLILILSSTKANGHWRRKTANVAITFLIALMIHGGGFVIGSKALIPPFQIGKLVDEGFVVVCPDYRLCPTINVHDGPLADVRDAYSWIQEELPRLVPDVLIDRQRIVAIGYSAGGTLALLLVS